MPSASNRLRNFEDDSLRNTQELKYPYFGDMNKGISPFMGRAPLLMWAQETAEVEKRVSHHRMASIKCCTDCNNGAKQCDCHVKKRKSPKQNPCTCARNKKSKPCKCQDPKNRHTDFRDKNNNGKVSCMDCGSSNLCGWRCECVSEVQKESVQKRQKCANCGGESSTTFGRERSQRTCQCAWVRL